MTFIVANDANVLYPNTLRDLLIRIAPDRAALDVHGARRSVPLVRAVPGVVVIWPHLAAARKCPFETLRPGKPNGAAQRVSKLKDRRR